MDSLSVDLLDDCSDFDWVVTLDPRLAFWLGKHLVGGKGRGKVERTAFVVVV